MHYRFLEAVTRDKQVQADWWCHIAKLHRREEHDSKMHFVHAILRGNRQDLRDHKYVRRKYVKYCAEHQKE